MKNNTLAKMNKDLRICFRCSREVAKGPSFLGMVPLTRYEI
jgi:hypothetical protein